MLHWAAKKYLTRLAVQVERSMANPKETQVRVFARLLKTLRGSEISIQSGFGQCRVLDDCRNLPVSSSTTMAPSWRRVFESRQGWKGRDRAHEGFWVCPHQWNPWDPKRHPLKRSLFGIPSIAPSSEPWRANITRRGNGARSFQGNGFFSAHDRSSGGRRPDFRSVIFPGSSPPGPLAISSSFLLQNRKTFGSMIGRRRWKAFSAR